MTKRMSLFLGTALLLAGSLTLPVVAASDARNDAGCSGASCGQQSGCCAHQSQMQCGPDCALHGTRAQVRKTGAGSPACCEACAAARPVAGRPLAGPVASGKRPSRTARMEELGLWLNHWVTTHPRLAEKGKHLLLAREFHPAEFLRALDDLPGPARRSIIEAMERLAEYERLLGKHPDEYRGFIKEHFPERFHQMKRLWGPSGKNKQPRETEEEEESETEVEIQDVAGTDGSV